jgi:hypothetical protein
LLAFRSRFNKESAEVIRLNPQQENVGDIVEKLSEFGSLRWKVVDPSLCSKAGQKHCLLIIGVLPNADPESMKV